MTAILGISAFYHDSTAAIVVDGIVVAAAQEERFTRRKHESGFPHQAIAYCLAEAGIKVEDLDHVTFYEKPFLKFERILETYLHYSPRGIVSFSTAMPIWLKSKLYLSRVISKGLGHRYRKRIIFPEHHESHAASAFFPSPFEEAAILTVDGVGEWATTTLGTGKGNRIELQQELNFPDSLGLLYSAFTYFCGFRVNGGEGKLMGLAPYGQPIYVDRILDQLVDLKEDGSFRLDQSFFNYCTGDTMTSGRFNDLFEGPPRVPESEITIREQNMAASIQSVCETILLNMANHLHAQTGMPNLCIAGGVALNCVANGRLLRESPFENVWVQPAAGDSGGALGAALLVWHQLLGHARNSNESATPFLGPSVNAAEAKVYLESQAAVFQEFENEDDLFDNVAGQLVEQNTVGWFQDRMELGPRALGNRSILADPRDAEMQNQLNNKVKFRESFRPFAPVVLAQRCHEFFQISKPSPYMLFAAESTTDQLDSRQRPAVPAVTHVDGSARIQTVTSIDNPKLHQLLKKFEEKTGCPILVNTSFNVRGEPLVCSVAEAYRCLMKTDLDVLVIENLVLKRSDQPGFTDERESKTPVSAGKKLLMIWLGLTFPLRWLISKLVLVLIFILCITPLGFVKRVFNPHTFQPIDRGAVTYWKSRRPIKDVLRYFKQY